MTTQSLKMILGLSTTALLVVSAQAYAPQKATYSGLFFEDNGQWQQSAGTLTLKETARGTYSARVQLGRAAYSVSGAFDSQGATTRGILRRFDNTLVLNLQIDPNDPTVMTGTISDGTWTAQLIADQSVFDGRNVVCPDAGQYTMMIPGNFTANDVPGGDSYGTVTVTKAGQIRFAASLADSAKFSQSTTISKGGNWPLYSSLYSGYGAMYGWLLFNSDQGAISGDAYWIRPEMPWTWFYRDGFATVTGVTGSTYTKPGRGEKILNLGDATIEFNGGNLIQGFTNQVVLDSKNRVFNMTSNNRLSMSFSTSNGTFSGKAVDPVTYKWVNFRGVALQDQNVAAGFFLDWDKSGEVWLQGLQ